MKCVEFVGQNLIFDPPAGMKDCGKLPVMVTNQNTMVSVWKLEGDDLKILQAGGHIMLHVWGGQHPPVAVTVGNATELP